jgi:hypothetical protein
MGFMYNLNKCKFILYDTPCRVPLFIFIYHGKYIGSQACTFEKLMNLWLCGHLDRLFALVTL